MSGNKAVLDSNILIYLSKKILGFKKITKPYSNIYISAISYMEVLGFRFDDKEEKKLIDEFLNNIEILHTDSQISNKVINYRQHHKIKLPDAIILATASKLKADLITNNLSDFKDVDKEVNIVIPFKNIINK